MSTIMVSRHHASSASPPPASVVGRRQNSNIRNNCVSDDKRHVLSFHIERCHFGDPCCVVDPPPQSLRLPSAPSIGLALPAAHPAPPQMAPVDRFHSPPPRARRAVMRPPTARRCAPPRWARRRRKRRRRRPATAPTPRAAALQTLPPWLPVRARRLPLAWRRRALTQRAGSGARGWVPHGADGAPPVPATGAPVAPDCLGRAPNTGRRCAASARRAAPRGHRGPARTRVGAVGATPRRTRRVARRGPPALGLSGPAAVIATAAGAVACVGGWVRGRPGEATYAIPPAGRVARAHSHPPRRPLAPTAPSHAGGLGDTASQRQRGMMPLQVVHRGGSAAAGGTTSAPPASAA